MEKIKILQVTGIMNRGGAEVMLMDIFRNISSDFEFHFLINYKVKQGIVKGDFDDEILKLGGTIHYIGAQWDVGPIKYLKQFSKICKQIGTPNAVHIHMNAKSGIIALGAKLAGIKKIIVHAHGELVFKGFTIKNIAIFSELVFQKILVNTLATDFWGCSELAIKSLFYKNKIRNDKTVIINNAINVDSYLNISNVDVLKLKNELKIPENHLIIGAVGRVVRRKNIKFIIEILYELNKKGIDFIFLNVGKIEDKVYFEEVIQCVKKYKLEDKIINLGVRSDIPIVMSTFDIFISPAHNEAFGMVAAEAQAAGLPCVLSTEFPKTIDMKLGLVSFVNNFNSSDWAKVVLGVNYNLKVEKLLIKKNFLELGFDIKSNVKNIEKLYLLKL